MQTVPHLAIAGLAIATLLAQAQTKPEPVRRGAAWTRHWDRPIADASLSANGKCVAVTLRDAVAVVDAAGRELWQWSFAGGNRFVVANEVAVAPSCEFLAFVGDAGYRFSWIVHRGGRRIPIRTQSTPLSVAISHRGDLVAIGTSANDVWLFNADATRRWRTHLEEGCSFASCSSAGTTTRFS